MAEFDRLKKWESSLNACIRCGYCYEHCPIYKTTRWEIDSPRGKMTLAFGLLHGELEPSDYIAEKLFECFHCQRCQDACSSGVYTIDVFADARADLIDAGFEPVGTTSWTDHDKCAVCLNCVRMCPHEARSFENRIQTDRLKCQCCGSCLDACSARAIHIEKGFGTGPDELRESVAEFLLQPEAKGVVFGCSWSTYPGFQTAQLAGEGENCDHRVFVTACTGRLTAAVVLDAFERGAWGVLLVGCPDDECEHGGNMRAQARMEMLRDVLAHIGVAPERLQVAEASKKKPKVFSGHVREFMEAVRGLGPLHPGGAP